MSLPLLRSLVAAASLCLVAAPAASLSTLQDVIDGGGFTTISGLTFDNFQAVFLGLPVDATDLFVETRDSGFSLIGPLGAADGEMGSVALSFDVWAAEATVIIGAALFANPAASGQGIASVSETVVHGGASDTLDVFASGNTVVTSDAVSFDGVEHLSVTKDISVSTSGAGDSARISLVNQDFGVKPIPEPGAALLALVGFTLVGSYLKRS